MNTLAAGATKTGHLPVRGISDDDVRKVNAPTLIVLGDRDIPTLEHAVELTHLLPNSHLVVLPGGHGDYLGEQVAAQQLLRKPSCTVGLIEGFLDSAE